MKIYQAINAVQSDLARVGITKEHRNQQQGYNFRGIDDVYNVLSPLLAKHGLCILPRVNARHCEERKNAKGTSLFYVSVDVEFDFVSAEDGSKHTVRTFGEAMDSGDKATNKAMSAAYKYAAFQAFAIPTVGDNDSETHEVMAGFDVTAALDLVESCQTVDRLSEIWKTQGAMAVSAQDAGGHAALKAAVKERKAALEKVAA